MCRSFDLPDPNRTPTAIPSLLIKRWPGRPPRACVSWLAGDVDPGDSLDFPVLRYQGLEELSSVNSPQATRILDRSQLDPYVLLWRNIPLGAVIILSFLLGSAKSPVPGRKIPTTIVVGFFALGTGAMIFCGELCVRILHAEIHFASFDRRRIWISGFYKALH